LTRASLPGGRTVFRLVILGIFLLYIFLRFPPGWCAPAVLDRHGRDGDLDPGRRCAHRQRGARSSAHRSAPVPEGLHPGLLGDGDMVDSDVAPARILAARGPPISPALRPGVLGPGVPARY